MGNFFAIMFIIYISVLADAGKKIETECANKSGIVLYTLEGAVCVDNKSIISTAMF